MENMTLAEYIEQRTPICTSFEHVQHLINSSSAVTKNGQPAVPNVHELVLGNCVGGRTIYIGEDKWMFSVDKNIIMESPDELFGEYPRIDFNFQLFMGDENGFLVAKAQGTLTHAVWVSKLKKEGCIQLGMMGYEIIKVPSYCKMVGNPKRMDVFHSGTILPKQDGDTPMNTCPETLVSFWKNVGYANLRHHVKNYCVANFEGPYRCEVPLNDEDAWTEFREVEF